MGWSEKPADDERVLLTKRLVLVAAGVGVVATALVVVLRGGDTTSDAGPSPAVIDTRGYEQEPAGHHVLVVRSTGGVSPTTISECYTFYDSGRVELRRAGHVTLMARPAAGRAPCRVRTRHPIHY
jgi:hypothetical protein